MMGNVPNSPLSKPLQLQLLTLINPSLDPLEVGLTRSFGTYELPLLESSLASSQHCSAHIPLLQSFEDLLNPYQVGLPCVAYFKRDIYTRRVQYVPAIPQSVIPQQQLVSISVASVSIDITDTATTPQIQQQLRTTQPASVSVTSVNIDTTNQRTQNLPLPETLQLLRPLRFQPESVANIAKERGGPLLQPQSSFTPRSGANIATEWDDIDNYGILWVPTASSDATKEVTSDVIIIGNALWIPVDAEDISLSAYTVPQSLTLDSYAPHSLDPSLDPFAVELQLLLGQLSPALYQRRAEPELQPSQHANLSPVSDGIIAMDYMNTPMYLSFNACLVRAHKKPHEKAHTRGANVRHINIAKDDMIFIYFSSFSSLLSLATALILYHMRCKALTNGWQAIWFLSLICYINNVSRKYFGFTFLPKTRKDAYMWAMDDNDNMLNNVVLNIWFLF